MALGFTTMPALLSSAKAAPRFRTVLVLVFAAFALLLAMAGVFAVVNYLVARRVPELGLRLALGADRFTLARQVVLRSVRVAFAGVLAGLALSAVSARLVESFLYGLPPLDPLTHAATAAALLIASALAALVPAWRAARVDPLVALRQE
jgi:putative ABC transport system permease protein